MHDLSQVPMERFVNERILKDESSSQSESTSQIVTWENREPLLSILCKHISRKERDESPPSLPPKERDEPPPSSPPKERDESPPSLPPKERDESPPSLPPAKRLSCGLEATFNHYIAPVATDGNDSWMDSIDDKTAVEKTLGNVVPAQNSPETHEEAFNNYVMKLQDAVENGNVGEEDFINYAMKVLAAIENGNVGEGVTLSAFKNVSNDAAMIEGYSEIKDYGVRVSEHLWANMILLAHPDIFKNAKFGPYVTRVAFELFCCMAREMASTRLGDLSYGLLCKWSKIIKDSLLLGLDVGFAHDHLRKMAHIYLGNFSNASKSLLVEHLGTAIENKRKSIQAMLDQIKFIEEQIASVDAIFGLEFRQKFVCVRDQNLGKTASMI
ncbi:hypothetical protein CCACVL1_18052 [Corchorus capsularis]|uniref:Uncharacterized protein n=1 Tax=Corchorus capsularis TaxID=210143 RepID=A0A1R3HND0_COCAP|nr:hypothetical protein CCACVL1_18052 [Corchorus capsularis]